MIRKKRLWLAAGLGLAVLIYTLNHADLGKLAQSIHDLNIFWGAMTLAAGALSYLCIAAVLHLLLRGMGHEVSFSASFRISLISTTLNYIMAMGGLSGMAAKVYLLAREKVPPSSTLSISMVHGFLTNTVAIVFIYLGFFFLYSDYQMSRKQVEAGIVVLLIAFALTWITVQAIVHESFRRRLWDLAYRAGSALCRKLRHPRLLHRERAESFFEKFNDSMNMLVKSSGILWKPALFAAIDWLMMFLCLKWAFSAVNYPVDNQTIMVGFSIGIFTALFSITPASIGVMEGSMAGSFYLMGLDYDHALIAVLVYRFVYFLLPMLLSLFYSSLIISLSKAEVTIEDPPHN